jgi:hypothetical protein
MELINLVSIISVLIILIVIITILIFKNIELKKKINLEKKKLLYYQEETEKIKIENPGTKELEYLNKTARDFFSEKFNLNYTLTYSEIAKELRKKGKEKYAEFCEIMPNLIYSKNNSDSIKIKNAIELFYDLVNVKDIIPI